MLSKDCRVTVATRTTFVRGSQKFRIVNSPKFRGDRFATFAQTSRDRRTTVARNFYILGKKIRIKFLNILETVARNSHDSEILA